MKLFLVKQGLSGFKNSRLTISLIIMALTAFLYLNGLMAIVGYNLIDVVKNIQKQITIKIFVDPTVSESDLKKISNELASDPIIASIKYISPENGLKELSNFLGENMIKMLDENPLPPVFELEINELYLSDRLISEFVKNLKKNSWLLSIDYPKKKLQLYEKYGLSLFLIVVLASAFFFFVSVALVNSTIRVSIKDRQKEIILTRLLGGTNYYIRFPLFVEGVIVGTIASLTTILLLIITRYISQLFDLNFLPFWKELYWYVLVLGLFIGMVGSQIAVKKYIYMDEEML